MLFVYSLFPPLPDTVTAVQLNENCCLSLAALVVLVLLILQLLLILNYFSLLPNLHEDLLVIQQFVMAKLPDVSSIKNQVHTDR